MTGNRIGRRRSGWMDRVMRRTLVRDTIVASCAALFASVLTVLAALHVSNSDRNHQREQALNAKYAELFEAQAQFFEAVRRVDGIWHEWVFQLPQTQDEISNEAPNDGTVVGTSSLKTRTSDYDNGMLVTIREPDGSEATQVTIVLQKITATSRQEMTESCLAAIERHAALEAVCKQLILVETSEKRRSILTSLRSSAATAIEVARAFDSTLDGPHQLLASETRTQSLTVDTKTALSWLNSSRKLGADTEAMFDSLVAGR